MHPAHRLLTFPMLAAGLLSMACGASTGDRGEISIASDFPTAEGVGQTGLSDQKAVQYAVSTAGRVRGFKITLKPYDHTVNGTHDPQKGVANVQDMLTNPLILGMVGPNNSNVAVAEIPIANHGSLAMISPGTTNECLTQTFDYCLPVNKFTPQSLRPTGVNNYFRVAANDTFQGPAMADYVSDTLKLKNVAVWSDGETYGKGVADRFSAELAKKGGQVVLRQDFDTKVTTDFTPFLKDARDKGAQAIYAGAVTGTKVCVPRGQSKGILDSDYYLSSDGSVNAACIKSAGDLANDKTISTVAVGDATQSDDAHAKTVVEGFKQQYPNKDDLQSYTFPTYDCAAILIDAIGRAIDANGGNRPSRAQVVAAVAKTTNFKGTTGNYTFDKNGDPTQPTVSFFHITGSPPAWVFATQFAVGSD